MKKLIWVIGSFTLLLVCNSTKAQVYQKNKDPFFEHSSSSNMLDILIGIKDTSVLNTQMKFMLYSCQKLWKADKCGHKGYRRNIYDFMHYYFLNGNELTKDDIIKIFGTPDDIKTTKRGNETYIYDLEKDKNCDKPTISFTIDFIGSKFLNNQIFMEDRENEW